MGTLQTVQPTTDCHVVAMPYPGRGHINPLMNICKELVSRNARLLVTFVITEEWLGLLGSDPKPDRVRFRTVPNVIPSEHGRAKNFSGFFQSVTNNLKAPFEELLDRLDTPVNVIIADTYLIWMTDVGNRRNIPVASLWPMSASVFSVFRHFDLVEQNGHFPIDLSVRGHEIVDYIPGIPTIRVEDLPTIFEGEGRKVLKWAKEATSKVSKAQFLLSTSVYELESQVFDALKAKFPFPVYPLGPSIPHSQLQTCSNYSDTADYFKWLDSQPQGSVLYISLGSFLSVSAAQLDEIVAGIRGSGTRYLWVARDNVSMIKEYGTDDDDELGFVVPWCDQLRVLCHASIGGFWTHCGWNSTLEAVYSGVPMLTCPIFWDQVPDSKQIVEDWKIGYNVIKKGGTTMSSRTTDDDDHGLVKREKIAELVKKFMNKESSDGKVMSKRVKEIQEVCRKAIAKGGSSDSNLDAFIRNISHGPNISKLN
uniref:Uncharacterized protein n=1 Tax=Cannabis sativa TaxID=3483 RepID=A0A803Q0U6_CANSA